MNRTTPHVLAALMIALGAAWLVRPAYAAAPLKVFILAGQSNMQGHAAIPTLSYMAHDPKSAPLLQQIVDSDGKPRVFEHVWITYLSEGRGGDAVEKNGQLTAGFGANPDKLGPELAFGITMHQLLGEPILLIKTAWGGKSLHTDFRPPSSGPFLYNEAQLEDFRKNGKDPAAEQAARTQASGHYYRLMLEHVNKVLAEPSKYCPEYDPKQGYELAGFVWFQGWNDAVDSGVYPNRDQPGGYDLYSTLMAQFIRDVRKDLQAPNLPFVIGVMGVGGPVDLKNPNRYTASTQNFRDAMAAPASLPEFQGNVAAVRTEVFWDSLQSDADTKRSEIRSQIDKLKKEGKVFAEGEEQKLYNQRLEEALTPEEKQALAGISNFGFHYLGSAKILSRIGQAMAEAMGPMAKK